MRRKTPHVLFSHPSTPPPSTHPVVLGVDLHHPDILDDTVDDSTPAHAHHPPPPRPTSTHPVVLEMDLHHPDVTNDPVDDTDDRLCDVRDVQDPTVLQTTRTVD